jgi:hypothetical protein
MSPTPIHRMAIMMTQMFVVTMRAARRNIKGATTVRKSVICLSEILYIIEPRNADPSI